MLGGRELVLFKALFDRPRDWVDIATVVDAGAVDAAAVRQALLDLVGATDHRVTRWDTLAG